MIIKISTINTNNIDISKTTTLENTSNTDNIYSGINTVKTRTCGSGLKYKNCHGRPGHENDPIPAKKEAVVAKKETTSKKTKKTAKVASKAKTTSKTNSKKKATASKTTKKSTKK